MKKRRGGCGCLAVVALVALVATCARRGPSPVVQPTTQQPAPVVATPAETPEAKKERARYWIARNREGRKQRQPAQQRRDQELIRKMGEWEQQGRALQAQQQAANQAIVQTPAPANPPQARFMTGAPPARSAVGIPQAELVRVRLVPFVTVTGLQAQMVLTDWKSTGTAPVRSIHADITAYGEDGRILSSSAPDYYIFATEKKPVNPGEIYRRPERTGFILFPDEGMATRVEVAITRVD